MSASQSSRRSSSSATASPAGMDCDCDNLVRFSLVSALSPISCIGAATGFSASTAATKAGAKTKDTSRALAEIAPKLNSMDMCCPCPAALPSCLTMALIPAKSWSFVRFCENRIAALLKLNSSKWQRSRPGARGSIFGATVTPCPRQKPSEKQQYGFQASLPPLLAALHPTLKSPGKFTPLRCSNAEQRYLSIARHVSCNCLSTPGEDFLSAVASDKS
mmetsp:Transcript_51015/g.119308  ORF Transcript_51015/g.119308 Transcript_51015/m.119308 type:complete len:218 (-) Transcript_51015:75-728(-)